MKKRKTLFGKAREKVQDLCIRAHAMFMRAKEKALYLLVNGNPLLADCRGDLAVSTIGGIIIAVVMVGLIIVAVKAFFPGFFTGMFTSMQSKLNANW
jgi:hypothetical protein